MAAITAALAATAAVAGGINAAKQNNAAKDAATAQVNASQDATNLQRDIYNDQRNLLAPSITAGSEARARQMLMEGYSPDQVKQYLASTRTAVGAAAPATQQDLQSRYPDLYRLFQSGDTVHGQRYSNFTDYAKASGVDTTIGTNPTGGTGAGAPSANDSWVDNYQYAPSSPSYQFRLDQGSKALQRSAAASGNLFSGQTGQALSDYGQNTASQEFENDYRRLGEIAGDGTQSTGNTVNVGTNFGNSAAQNTVNAGNARASGYVNQANAFTSGLNNIVGALGQTYGVGSKQGWFG